MSKVFIGVGHGGKDSGAIGRNGIYEKDLNLAIALSLNAELQRHDVLTMMSRTTDENDPLTEEIAECNRFSPDLALDVHNNAGGGDGFEGYYSILDTANGRRSKALAQKLEQQVLALGQNSRGCKTKVYGGNDYFGFIRETRCPAVLVECAFVDTKDIELIDDLHEQKAMGIALAKAVLAELGIGYIPIPEVTLPSPPTAQGRTITFAELGELLKGQGIESIRL